MISTYQAAVYRAVTRTGQWMTAKQVTEATRGAVQPRTVRHHLLLLTEAGVLERMDVFPERLYRVAAAPTAGAARVVEGLAAVLAVAARES